MNRADRYRYLGLKRMLAVVTSVALWLVSMKFSYEGFKFQNKEILWFGIVLALTVTVVELVFNTQISKLNPTLLLIGIVCYLYGVYTNVTGFYVLQHGEMSDFFAGTNWFMATFAGLITEILPEALFAWGIGAFDEGDLVGNISDMFAPEKAHQVQPQNNPSHKPAFNHQQSKHNSSRKSRVSPFKFFNEDVEEALKSHRRDDVQ